MQQNKEKYKGIKGVKGMKGIKGIKTFHKTSVKKKRLRA